MTYTVKSEELEQMVRIYNTLLNVKTSGEDSFIIVDCLRAFEEVMKAISERAASAQETVPTEIVEE